MQKITNYLKKYASNEELMSEYIENYLNGPYIELLSAAEEKGKEDYLEDAIRVSANLLTALKNADKLIVKKVYANDKDEIKEIKGIIYDGNLGLIIVTFATSNGRLEIHFEIPDEIEKESKLLKEKWIRTFKH